MAEQLVKKISETDMTQFTTAELQTDLAACITDIKLCKKALAIGITHYNKSSVGIRLSANTVIQRVIEEELTRRKRNLQKQLLRNIQN